MAHSARASHLRRWCALSGIALAAGVVIKGPAATVIDNSVMGLSVVNVARGVRLHRPKDLQPWRLLMWAVGFGFAAGALAAAEQLLVRGHVPYPAPSDAANAVAYLIAAAAGIAFVKHRSRRSDPTSLIDAGIVTGGVAALAWAFVIVPDLQATTSSVIGKETNVFFDLLSMVLVAIVTRLAVGPGTRNGSWYWLSSAVASALASDLLLAVWSTSEKGGWLVAGSNALAAWTCASVAAAALHPRMARLTDPVEEAVAPMSRGRLATMIASALVAPAILLAQSRGPSLVFTAGVVVVWAGLCTLIVLRMSGLLKARERLARVESIVRDAGSAMVAATSPGLIYEAAAHGITQLLAAADVEGTVLGGLLRDGELVLGAGDSAVLEPQWAGSLVTSPVALEAVASSSVSELTAPGTDALPPPLRSPWVGVFPVVSKNAERGVLMVAAGCVPPAAIVAGCESVARLLALTLDSARAARLYHQQAAERRFQKLFEHSADIVAVLGRAGEPGFVSPSAGHLLGIDPEQTAHLDLRRFVHAEDRKVYDALVRDAARGGASPVEARLGTSSGEWRWFEVVARDLSAVPEVGSVVVTARHITDRKNAEERLAGSERRFRSLVQNSTDVITIVDDAGSITWVSESVRGVLGLDPEDLIGTSVLALVEDDTRGTLESALADLQQHRATERQVTVHVSDSRTRRRVFAVTLADRRSDSAVGQIVCNARDITDEKSLEEDLRYQALHDDLTGLPNRVLLRQRVEHALARRAADGHLIAVLFIDLDDFKTVNDGLGHAVGDELLSQAAARLRKSCRTEDTAGRLGGDEFAVLIESAATVDEVLGISRRLRDALQEPFYVARRRLTVTASVGVAATDTPEPVTPDELLRNADAAMYVAKRRGKDHIEVFEPSMHLHAFNRLELKEDLVGAVSRHELRIHYQPVIELRSGRTVGFEGLVRWEHPIRGLLPPTSFVPLAEETGLIVPIGWWCIESAVHQLREWRSQGRAVTVSVNLSARQLETPGLLDDLATLLHSTGTTPRSLTIELTESVVVSPEAALRLEALRALGVGVAADDFGSGVASYASLQRFPFTAVKIDKSLIDGLLVPGRATAQIQSIVQMAHSSDLVVVAEGVEEPEQAEILAGLGCDYGQGYLFGRPAPAEEAFEPVPPRALSGSAVDA